jgi:hypothetical protein
MIGLSVIKQYERGFQFRLGRISREAAASVSGPNGERPADGHHWGCSS